MIINCVVKPTALAVGVSKRRDREMKNVEKQKNDSKELLLDKELNAKILEMEQEAYVFPKRMGKKDYLFTLAVVILCLVGIIVGGFLG